MMYSFYKVKSTYFLEISLGVTKKKLYKSKAKEKLVKDLGLTVTPEQWEVGKPCYYQGPILGFGSKFMNTCYTVLNPSIHMLVKAGHARTDDESMS